MRVKFSNLNSSSFSRFVRMKISAEELSELIDLAIQLKGKTITISESISRNRTSGGHNRHFSTQTKFSLIVENVFAAFSGAQLLLTSSEAQYGIALSNVAGFHRRENELKIIEHFEQETERLTKIVFSEL